MFRGWESDPGCAKFEVMETKEPMGSGGHDEDAGWAAAVVQADGLNDFIADVEDHLEETQGSVSTCQDEPTT